MPPSIAHVYHASAGAEAPLSRTTVRPTGNGRWRAHSQCTFTPWSVQSFGRQVVGTAVSGKQLELQKLLNACFCAPRVSPSVQNTARHTSVLVWLCRGPTGAVHAFSPPSTGAQQSQWH